MDTKKTCAKNLVLKNEKNGKSYTTLMYIPYNEGMHFCESKNKAFKKSALFLDMYKKSIETSNKKTTKQHHYHESRPTSLSFTQDQAFCHNATHAD